MFLQLAHTRTEVFKHSRKLIMECYRITKDFPSEEKYAMVQQIRRAALSVHLNIAEGCSRRSEAERKRFFEVARGSVIEIDTAFDVANELGFATSEKLQLIGHTIISIFKQLSGLINKVSMN